MPVDHIFFAGGGTGGHIYPALAIAEQVQVLRPGIKITFFCSDRKIDSQILSKTGFDFVPLGALGFSKNPVSLVKFVLATVKSRRDSLKIMSKSSNSVLVGGGGFVSAGPVLAAHKLDIPAVLVNTDTVPGKANVFLAKYAKEIYCQFDYSRNYFKDKNKVVVTGCPLRADFSRPDPARAIAELQLDPGKKIVLVTGASTGAKTINETMALLLSKLKDFGHNWQVVHLSGKGDFTNVSDAYKNCPISCKVIDYYDRMADLFAASELVIGRCGAVSVAEYAASGVPAICMPYPFHADNHQKINAAQLEKAGCAMILDDQKDATLNAERLWPLLLDLLQNPENLARMKSAAKNFGKADAARQIASRLLLLK